MFSVFNTHKHKMGPREPNHYFFGDHLYSKYARKLRFHVFLHFNARKHLISSLKLQIFSNLIRDPGALNRSKIHNFLWIRSTSGKMTMSYVFWHEKGGMHGIWVLWHFSSKSGGQRYTAMWCLFLKKHLSFLNQKVTFKCSPC